MIYKSLFLFLEMNPKSCMKYINEFRFFYSKTHKLILLSFYIMTFEFYISNSSLSLITFHL